MKTSSTITLRSLRLAVTAASFVIAGYSSIAFADAVKVTLSGSEEVPPVTTSASGTGTITVNADKTVSGSVTTSGVNASMAHIHEGAPGKNGPPIIPLTKGGDNSWTVPSGSKLTDAQYQAYKGGNLYINVHSEAHKGGEIRGQLKPM
jgi:CHRD domain-containing protein